MIEFVAPANTPVIDRGVITEPTGVEEPAEDGDVEAKARHVRDAAFWGAPVGTPLPLPRVEVPQGMKPGRRQPLKPRDFHIPGFGEAQYDADNPPAHLYRAVSEADWAGIQERGYIQSDERMNVVQGEGTVAADRDPSFYLPTGVGEQGRILRIRFDPQDEWDKDDDAYWKTNRRIPLDRVDAVTDVYTDQTRPQDYTADQLARNFSNEIYKAVIDTPGFDGYGPLAEFREAEYALYRQHFPRGRDVGFPNIKPYLDDLQSSLDGIGSRIDNDYDRADYAVLAERVRALISKARTTAERFYPQAEGKARHVRDAAFWGAPVGTPLPLPKKPDAPDVDLPHQTVLPKVVKADAQELIHTYQAADYAGELDLLEKIQSNYERQYNSPPEPGNTGDPIIDDAIDSFNVDYPSTPNAKDRERERERLARIEELRSILDNDGPYPQVSIEVLAEYLDDVTKHWHYLKSRQRLLDLDEDNPDLAKRNAANARIAKVNVDALDAEWARRIRALAEEYGVEVSDPHALLRDHDDYRDMISRTVRGWTLEGDDWPGVDPADAKVYVQQSIYERMSPEDRAALRAELPRDSYMDSEGLDQKIPDSGPEAEKLAVRAMVSTWAGSSGDNHTESVAMQRIAQELFGLDDAYMPGSRDDDHPLYRSEFDAAVEKSLARGTKGRRAFLQAMYDSTQEWLRDNDIEAIECYRGMRAYPSTKPMERIYPWTDADVDEDGFVHIAQQPMSSWAVANKRQAAGFGPYILSAIIPREKILATPATGYGCLGESEVVVIGDRLVAKGTIQ